MLEKRLVSKPRPLHLKTRNHRCLHTLHHHILHPLTLRRLLPKLPSRARVNILLPESLPKRPQTRLPPPRKTTSPFLPLRQILGSNRPQILAKVTAAATAGWCDSVKMNAKDCNKFVATTKNLFQFPISESFFLSVMSTLPFNAHKTCKFFFKFLFELWKCKINSYLSIKSENLRENEKNSSEALFLSWLFPAIYLISSLWLIQDKSCKVWYFSASKDKKNEKSWNIKGGDLNYR